MNFDWNWKKVTIVSGIVAVVVVTNVGQALIYWKPKQNDLIQNYTQEIAVLQGTLDEIGPLTPVWTVKQGNKEIFAGKEITDEDLDMKQLPASFVTDNYVTDAESIVGNYFKIAVADGTPLLKDFVLEKEMDDTLREFDAPANVLPVGLKVGDYIDFRLVYPRGEDYIVLSHKRIQSINANTVKLHLTESEIHTYQAAVVDYYLQAQKGSMIWMAKYVEPGAQKPAQKYYAVPKNILAVMTADPNIIQKANAELNNNIRTMINGAISGISQEDGSAINAGRNDTKAKVDEAQSQKTAEEKQQADKQAEIEQQQALQQAQQQALEQPNTPAPGSEQGGLNVGEGVVE